MDSEELPEQSQSGKNKAEKSDEKRGGEGYIRLERKIKVRRKKKINKKRHFLELPEDYTVHFQISMVYDLLKHRIIYVGDDKDPTEGGKKMDETWINYYGMPIYFGMREFAIVTCLRCDRPKKPLIKETPRKKSKASRTTKPPPLNKGKALSKQPPRNVKDYPYEVSHLKILRWFAAKSSTRIKEVDLFNPSDYAVVHPWIMPIEQELEMTSFITLGLVDTIANPMVELIKKKLDEITTIRRAVRQDSGASSRGVTGGVVGVGGSHPDADAVSSCDYEHFNGPSHPYIGLSHPYSGSSQPSYSYGKYKMCKDRQDKLFEKLDAITEFVEKLKFKRGVILSKKVREPYTPTVAVRRKKRDINQILSNLKLKKITTPPSPKVAEVQGLIKKVDIYATLGSKEKTALEKTLNSRQRIHDHTMHTFSSQDFKHMKNILKWYVEKYVDEILCLMRGRKLAYPDTYNVVDRIMDLNFYNNFKNRYNEIIRLAKTLGGSGFDWLVSTFQWDEDMIYYAREKMPYPHDKFWTKAKRILAVINVDVKKILVVEILFKEGNIKVYDCNLLVFDDRDFFIHMQPLLELFCNLLR
ncbi:hypothetical protein FXO37_33012 [Capsicum annuum]|nr:hypothetical protein FXO37_33012 [Capsicum annuum]